MATPTQKRLVQKRLADIRQANNAQSKWFKWTGFAGKTFWDWLQLLIIPIILAGATIGFGWWQTHLADVQHQQDQAIALDQQEATILQTYIDNIQDLLLKYNLLKASSSDIKNPYHDVATLARARTLTALQGLDPERKGRLVQFLYEARLIGFYVPNGRVEADYKLYTPIITLDGADLSSVDLSGTDLSGIDFYKADLRNANFSGTDLAAVNLSGADLQGADLQGVDLRGADLWGADLRGADLTEDELDLVSTCQDAKLPEGLTCYG